MNSVITLKGRTKMAQARAGIKALPKIIGMAFGNGGVNADGTVQPPQEESLYHELLRKEIRECKEITETCYRFSASLDKEELVDEAISEIGLYDEENDLVAIKTFRRKEKDSDMEMIFEIDDQF